MAKVEIGCRIVFNKKKTQRYVALPADNGRLLFSAETFTQKQSAWKNIFATMKKFKSPGMYIQDETLKDGIVVYYAKNGKAKVVDVKPAKPYKSRK